jgi:hypothetical protein
MMSDKKIHSDAIASIEHLFEEHDIFPSILSLMAQGEATAELKKRYFLREIDEAWVTAIEETLPSLDIIIRSPTRYIEDREEVLPIELTRKVSPQSLRHLAQHTDLIAKIEGDRITPSKLLNVFKEETLQTYENKFVNTLINRLVTFVSRRYQTAKNAGLDEKTTALNISQSFKHNDANCRISLKVEVSESTDYNDSVEKNYTYTTELWQRVKRLNDICTSYLSSDFAKAMGKSYIRPPVMRTNAILKNKNLRQCLELWQFIESYEDAGYNFLVEEKLETISEECLKDLYSTIAMQYAIFRNNTSSDFELEKTLDSNIYDSVIKPKIVEKLSGIDENEFNVEVERKVSIPQKTRYGYLTENDVELAQALDVSLKAEEIIDATGKTQFTYAEITEPENIPQVEDAIITINGEEVTPEEAEQIAEAQKDNTVVNIRTRKSFMAKLILSEDSVKEYYSHIKNALLSFKGIKPRLSWECETFYAGRNQYAKVTVRGKTLVLYLALDPNQFSVSKYHHKDASDVNKYHKVPLLLKVRSDRAARYAVELIETMFSEKNIAKIPRSYEDFYLPFESFAALAEKGYIKLVVPKGFELKYGNDVLAKTILGSMKS